MLELVHSDVCELNGILTRGVKRYFVTFIDDFSRYTYVYLMRNKNESFNMFKKYKTKVENQKDKRIKFLEVIEVVNIFHKSFLFIVRKMD